MKKLFQKLDCGVRTLRDRIHSYYCGSDNVIRDTRAETYVGEAVKILIAVVVGALLLTLSYSLMKDTVFAAVKTKVTELFNFSGT